PGPGPGPGEGSIFTVLLPLEQGTPAADGPGTAQPQPATRGCVLVALTGYGQAADRERALQAGFDRHLVKPVDICELAHYLASLG
ncbi:MAG: hybrid sensor histidine kinase/response regulator, partial [Ramlibacter sp.]|nr:hybrid sensor histidine kinase/response regulator [Ramlibacter sp.]